MTDPINKWPPAPPNSPVDRESEGLTPSEPSPTRSIDARTQVAAQSSLSPIDLEKAEFESALTTWCAIEKTSPEYADRLDVAKKLREAYASQAKSLDLSNYQELTNIFLPQGLKITSLILTGCKKLRYASLSNCSGLEFLSCHRCHKLKSLHLDNFTKLEWLDLFGCAHLKDLSLIGCSGLKYLTLSFCDRLIRRPNFAEHPNLIDLDASDCHAIASIDLSSLNHLEAVNLSRCTNLNFIQLGIHPNLTDFNLRECPSIIDLPDALLSLPPECIIYIKKTPLPEVTLERFTNLLRIKTSRRLPVPTFSPPLQPAKLPAGDEAQSP